MTERDILISAIVALWGSVIALAAYIKYLHDKHGKQQKDTIETVTREISKNTEVFDRVLKYIEKATRR